MGAFRVPLHPHRRRSSSLGTFFSWRLRRDFQPHAANPQPSPPPPSSFFSPPTLGLRIFAPVLTSQQLARAPAQIAPASPQLKVQPPAPASTYTAPTSCHSSTASSVRVRQHPERLLAALRYRPLQPNGSFQPHTPTVCPVDDAIHILNGRSSNLWYGSFFPDAPPIFEDDLSLQLLWSGDRRVFLWTEPGHVPKLRSRSYVIAASGGKEILSNQPNPF